MVAEMVSVKLSVAACRNQLSVQACLFFLLSTVSISALPYNGEYSSNNVLCINYTNSSAAVPPYRLQGCPNVFFNSAQNTSGVCSIPVEPENATDLLLIPNELEPALYSFYCLYSVSPTHTILSIAIVGK